MTLVVIVDDYSTFVSKASLGQEDFIGGGEYPTFYTEAKHTALRYDAICY